MVILRVSPMTDHILLARVNLWLRLLFLFFIDSVEAVATKLSATDLVTEFPAAPDDSCIAPKGTPIDGG